MKTTFHDVNEYPLHTINKAVQDIKDGIVNRKKRKIHFILCLPYKGDRGHKQLNSIKQTVKENGEINIQVAYTGKKLKSEFKVKDSTEFAPSHNVVYEAIRPNKNCKNRLNRLK